MRLFTHTIFSWGVGSLLFYLIGLTYYAPLVWALGRYLWAFMLVVSWLGNHMIDKLGHKMTPMGYPKRLPRTHSIFTAPIWGGLAALMVTFAMAHLPLIGVPFYWQDAVAIGVFVAYSHLFLDSLTMAGVYFTTKRIDLMHLSWDSPVGNGLAILAGFAALYVLFFQPSLLNALVA
ncbi:MAG: DUF1286 domain-containing protein [Nitrososphaerota archaeon]|jgi:hypothetical protein|nr:DUF1286 domain-containing protein [Nitrososphaerota archaeon]MDG6948737.1 DUF1286 domain-containing protein [Nitrososphaerota archaeon]